MAADISYPHPILGNRDDVAGTWAPVLAPPVLERNMIFLSFSNLHSGNEDVDELIECGDATVVVRISCRSTYFRKVVLTSSDTLTQQLDAGDVEGAVEVSVAISAKKQIIGYAPSAMHPDYPEAGFDLQPGDVIATCDRFHFLADKDFDPLRAPIPSLFFVSKSGDLVGTFEVDWGGDRVEILLGEAQWAQYNHFKEMAAAYLHASLVLPVLSQAISKLNSNDRPNTKWADRLETLLLRSDLDPDEPLEAAQRMLQDPFLRASEQIERRFMTHDSEDD